MIIAHVKHDFGVIPITVLFLRCEGGHFKHSAAFTVQITT